MDYKLTAVNFKRRTDAEVYSFSFKRGEGDRHGWAFALLHEESGTVAIHSDYGDWIYSWPAPGRGDCTLKEFVCHGSYDYMACKMVRVEDREQFDLEATKKTIVEHLRELRRLGTLDVDAFKEAVGDLEDFNEDNETVFWYDLPMSVRDRLDDFGRFARHTLTPEFLWLRDGVLPAFVEELRKALAARRWVARRIDGEIKTWQAEEAEISRLARIYSCFGTGETEEQALADLRPKLEGSCKP